MEAIWQCYDGANLVGEDIWEPDPSMDELIMVGPTEALTTGEAARQHSSLIGLLASFDAVMPTKGRPTRADR